jgi:hypothetical protein
MIAKIANLRNCQDGQDVIKLRQLLILFILPDD